MHDLDTRLERLAADATRDTVPPDVETIARRGRRRRRRQLAGTAALVAAVVAAGLVLPARLAGTTTGDRPLPATDVAGAASIGGYWFGKADASVFLEEDIAPSQRELIRRRIQSLEVVDQVWYESRAEAQARARELYKSKPGMTPKALEGFGFPESFRVRLDDPEQVQALQRALCPQPPDKASGSWESQEEAYRRLPEKLRRDGLDPAKVSPPYTPGSMHGAFHVTLDDPARVQEFHLALCGSRKTGACAGGLVVLEHPRKPAS